jgi:hypothetical protein
MDFKTAKIALLEGKKIYRRAWLHSYITKEGDDIKCYSTTLRYFNFTPDIIFCNDWICLDDPEKKCMDFTEALKLLKQKHKMRLKSWLPETYIKEEEDGANVYMSVISENPVYISYPDFQAQDWEVME